jgi:ketosteroid isomerase-like protein
VVAYHAAMASGDAEAAKALLADDLLVLEQGSLEDLELYTSHHLASDMAFAAAVASERREVRTTIVGEVAWVASLSQDTGSYRGRAVDDLGAELMILSREGGSWKIRAIHWSSRPSRSSR